MFGIGFPELILILIIGLVVFGPGKLPEVGRAVGKGLQEFKKATAGLTDTTKDLGANSSIKPTPPNPANPDQPAKPPVFMQENMQPKASETKVTEATKAPEKTQSEATTKTVATETKDMKETKTK